MSLAQWTALGAAVLGPLAVVVAALIASSKKSEPAPVPSISNNFSPTNNINPVINVTVPAPGAPSPTASRFALDHDTQQQIVDILSAIVRPEKEQFGPVVTMNPVAPFDVQQQDLAKLIAETFTRAGWDGRVGGAPGDIGRPIDDGITFIQFDAPAPDPATEARASLALGLLHKVLPMFGQHCTILHNESPRSATAIGSLIVGRPKARSGSGCVDGGKQ